MIGPNRMSSDEAKSRRMQALIWGMLCEALCLVAGGIAFMLTHHVLWLAIGFVVGLGFSAPAVIRFVRESREQDRASR
jgi:hypothetical protein